jgi:HAD superfamily hydrolase (TIGR01509 family)
MFDLGNVIVDISWDRMSEKWSELTGLSVEDINSRFVQDEKYNDHERGVISTEEYIEHLANQFNYPLTYDIFEAGWNSIYVGEVEGIRELMRELKPHYKLVGFSNTNSLHQVAWQTRFADILSPLDEIYCSHTMGHRKPDIESFQLVISKLGVHPEEIIFIDDLLANVTGAEQACIRAIHADSVQAMRLKLAELQVI